jgi:hypothetical protein
MSCTAVVERLTPWQFQSLCNLFEVEKLEPDNLVGAAVGDRLLGFVVALLLHTHRAGVGTLVQKYASNDVLSVFLAVECGVSYNELSDHKIGDFFEACLFCTFSSHNLRLEIPIRVVRKLVEFVDHHLKDGVTPAELRQTLQLHANASRNTALEDTEGSERLMQLYLAARQVDILEAGYDLRKTLAPIFTDESQHFRPSDEIKWLTRQGKERCVRAFLCCGQLAVFDDVKQNYFSKFPCDDVAEKLRHTGSLSFERTTRTSARVSKAVARWTCCRVEAIDPLNGATSYNFSIRSTKEAPCIVNLDCRVRDALGALAVEVFDGEALRTKIPRLDRGSDISAE